MTCAQLWKTKVCHSQLARSEPEHGRPTFLRSRTTTSQRHDGVLEWTPACHTTNHPTMVVVKQTKQTKLSDSLLLSCWAHAFLLHIVAGAVQLNASPLFQTKKTLLKRYACSNTALPRLHGPSQISHSSLSEEGTSIIVMHSSVFSHCPVKHQAGVGK
jgi:hypothetical protein